MNCGNCGSKNFIITVEQRVEYRGGIVDLDDKFEIEVESHTQLGPIVEREIVAIRCKGCGTRFMENDDYMNEDFDIKSDNIKPTWFD